MITKYKEKKICAYILAGSKRKLKNFKITHDKTNIATNKKEIPKKNNSEQILKSVNHLGKLFLEYKNEKYH